MKIAPNLFSLKSIDLDLATESQLSSCFKTTIIRIIMFIMMDCFYLKSIITDKSFLYFTHYLGLFVFTLLVVGQVSVLFQVKKKLKLIKGTS